MKFQPGDDVIVEFDGWEHRGEIKSSHNGWYYAKVIIDPLLDYGSVGARLAPESIVCVREVNVRHAEQSSD